jgi:hypothetical protein
MLVGEVGWKAVRMEPSMWHRSSRNGGVPDEAVPGTADFRDVLPSDGVVGDRLYVACATSAVVDPIGQGTSVELRARVNSEKWVTPPPCRVVKWAGGRSAWLVRFNHRFLRGARLPPQRHATVDVGLPRRGW